MALMLIKAIGIWFLFIPAAILNGALRDKALGPWLGKSIALPLSGTFLSLFIFLITWLTIPFLRGPGVRRYWMIGGLWLLLTVLFECLFGRYGMGKPWAKIGEAYYYHSVLKGNLWLLVLLTTAVSPYLTARLRGYFTRE